MRCSVMCWDGKFQIMVKIMWRRHTMRKWELNVNHISIFLFSLFGINFFIFLGLLRVRFTYFHATVFPLSSLCSFIFLIRNFSFLGFGHPKWWRRCMMMRDGRVAHIYRSKPKQRKREQKKLKTFWKSFFSSFIYSFNVQPSAMMDSWMMVFWIKSKTYGLVSHFEVYVRLYLLLFAPVFWAKNVSLRSGGAFMTRDSSHVCRGCPRMKRKTEKRRNEIILIDMAPCPFIYQLRWWL